MAKIDINSIPSNSHKSKEAIVQKPKDEKEALQPVVTGEVVVKKHSPGKKLVNALVAESGESIRNYIFTDVIIPELKKLLDNIVKNGIDAMLYGTSKPKSSSTRISYREYYDNDRRRDRDKERPRSLRNYFDDDIILENRGDAERVLSDMEDVIDRYDWVSVADMKDLANIRQTSYQDNKYGWNNLSRAEVVRARNGFWLKLPPAVPID